MKTFRIALSFLFCCTVFIGFSQEKTRKQLRAEKILAKEQEIVKLLDAKEFQFIARNSNSQYFPMVDLTNNPNFILFKPDFIKSDMPFFGRAFSGIAYGANSTGLKFEGKPEKFTIDKTNKEYQIEVYVKGQNDFFNISLLVSYSGSSILTMITNNRAPISYFGHIMPIEEETK